MARPKKGSGDNRDRLVRVRCTAVEKQKLLSLAAEAGMTESDFIRTRTLDAAPRTKKASPERAAFIEAAAQLGKIGSNVNQIARALNRKDGEDYDVPSAMIEYALKGVGDLTMQLIKLLEQHGH